MRSPNQRCHLSLPLLTLYPQVLLSSPGGSRNSESCLAQLSAHSSISIDLTEACSTLGLGVYTCWLTMVTDRFQRGEGTSDQAPSLCYFGLVSVSVQWTLRRDMGWEPSINLINRLGLY